MIDGHPCTPAELRESEFLRSQGYFKVPKVFDEAYVARAREAVWRHFDLSPDDTRFLGANATAAAFKDYRALQQIEEVHDLATDNRLLDVVQRFTGPNIAMPLNRHNHVSINPPSGEQAGIHRDHDEFTRGLISAVVYLEDADVENGCTLVIPGSHLWAGNTRPVNGGYFLEDTPYASIADQAVPVPMGAGDVLLFDGQIFHGVGQNTSERTRTSVALGYHSVDQLAPDHHKDKLLVVRGDDVYRGNDIPEEE